MPFELHFGRTLAPSSRGPQLSILKQMDNKSSEQDIGLFF